MFHLLPRAEKCNGDGEDPAGHRNNARNVAERHHPSPPPEPIWALIEKLSNEAAN